MKPFKIIVFFLIVYGTSLYSQETDESYKKATQSLVLLDKFKFDAGVFFPLKSVKLGVDGSNPNDEIDFGKVLDVKGNEATFFLKLDWRFYKIWILTDEYFSIKNSN